jgi:hypothetical protein
MSYSPTDTTLTLRRYRPDLFLPRNLTSPEQIEDAIFEFEQGVSKENFQKVLYSVVKDEELNVLLLVLSCERYEISIIHSDRLFTSFE